MAIKENLSTAYHDVLEMKEVIEDKELVIPLACRKNGVW